MEITFIGHAGFCFETEKSIIITDPWLSAFGAFDSAWFQFPQNHDMAAVIQNKFLHSKKNKYIYISHEHKDHFDLDFLMSLQSRDFELIIPNFRRNALYAALKSYDCKKIHCCSDAEVITLSDGSLRLYLDDSELNRDSALLINAGGFTALNMNDCKLYDRLIAILRENGKIDVFTCQFSGATWHPTCYDYSEEQYTTISTKKMMTKFESVARAIHNVSPRVYIPSAGPACFLDPDLFHLNTEPVNIFPFAPKFIEFLKKRLPKIPVCEMMPGDVLDLASCELTTKKSDRVTDENRLTYLTQYAQQYERYFADRKAASLRDIDSVFDRLREQLQLKLKNMQLAKRIQSPLYISFSDDAEKSLKIDFKSDSIEKSTFDGSEDHYQMMAPSWEIARVLDGHLTWEDFSLTFRMKLSRAPDVYQPLVQGFLILEPEDLDAYCNMVLRVESRSERILVETAHGRFAIDRYCPHQGGDLKCAWIEEERYITCPRHRWQFDLLNNGKCLTNNSSVNAMALDEDTPVMASLSVVPRLVRGIQKAFDAALDPADKPRDDEM